jgi:hypothetical protein
MSKTAATARSVLQALALTMASGTSAEESIGFDDDFGYSWESLKPYLDGDTLVIPVMDVIADSFWGSCLSAKMVNCPGGNVTEGTAIFSLLVADGRPVEAHVIGLAASMATVIILAADVRVLHTGCMLMVHEPALSWTGGNRHQLRSDATRLDIATESMLDIYEERTGHPRTELAALLAAETWLSAEDGRRLGFGTEVAPVAAEPVMAAVRADEAWNARRGAALAKYSALPPSVQHGTELGWSGPSLAELKAANALAEANNFPTLTMALDGVRRSRAVAPQPTPPREAAPPPRPASKPQPAASTSRTTPMDEELLQELGFAPGSTPTQAEITAAMKRKAAEAKAAKAEAEAERLARIEAQAREAAAENLRKEQSVAAAKAAEEAKVMADHTAKVEAFLADCTDGVRGIYEEMCWDGAGESRKPSPKGLELAQRAARTSPGALKSSLMGPSAQAQAARQVAATPPPATATATKNGPVTYTFGGCSTPINLTRLTGISHQALEERMAAMKARAESRGQRIDD